MGKDTHALSGPAQRTALEVLAANDVPTVIQRDDAFTPTPVISHAILVHNRGRRDGLADGIVITPSHNPPEDGGFKYNPPNGGPADTDVTKWIEARANALLRDGNAGVKRLPLQAAISSGTTHQRDLCAPTSRTCATSSTWMPSAARSSLWQSTRSAAPPRATGILINSIYGLDIAVTNPQVDPSFSFMTVDHDGAIRMDCSSPYAMARLVGLKDRYRVAFANDPDSDRHGIVTPTAGLMNPNHYLAVAIDYLLTHRPDWPADAAVGKTVVSSGMIDRVVNKLGRRLFEVPVGFKWFAPALFDSSCCFGGEESAGASFLRRDGSVWTTDKDGPIMNLLAAEITARTGRDRASATPCSRRNSVRPTTPASTHRRRRNRRRSWRGSRPIGQDREPGRRTDPTEAYPRPGEQRSHRRFEGGHDRRLVRGASVRYGSRVQGLRRELPRRAASANAGQRCAADRAGHLTARPRACNGTGAFSTRVESTAVIPGRAEKREPGIHIHGR